MGKTIKLIPIESEISLKIKGSVYYRLGQLAQYLYFGKDTEEQQKFLKAIEEKDTTKDVRAYHFETIASLISFIEDQALDQNVSIDQELPTEEDN